MPEHRTDSLFLDVEQVHLATDAAMVALLSLLNHGEMGLELLLIPPRRAVDTLQLRVGRVTAPIGTRQLHQLEGLRQFARGRQMRPAAQIDPVTLAIHGDGFVSGKLGHPFGLERLTLLGEKFAHLVMGPDFSFDHFVAPDDFFHLLLDGLEILGRELFLPVEVVIKTILGRRAESDLGTRE